MTSLLKLLFPSLKFPATVESWDIDRSQFYTDGPVGDDTERERHLMKVLDPPENLAIERLKEITLDAPEKTTF